MRAMNTLTKLKKKMTSHFTYIWTMRCVLAANYIKTDLCGKEVARNQNKKIENLVSNLQYSKRPSNNVEPHIPLYSLYYGEQGGYII